MTRAMTWPPETGVGISRLAFLAAREDLRRMARPWWLALLRGAEVYGGPYTGRSTMTRAARDAERGAAMRIAPQTMANEISSGRMAAYAFACDRVSELLSVEERQALRGRGALPAWFLPEVERVGKQIRKRGASAL
jgi:hypothetical protein